MRQLDWRDVTPTARDAVIPRPTTRVFRRRAELAGYFRRTGSAVALRGPRVDFEHEEAVLIATGARSSPAYDVVVHRVTEERRRIRILVRERAPRLGERVEAGIAYPYRLITLAHSERPVSVEWEGRP